MICRMGWYDCMCDRDLQIASNDVHGMAQFPSSRKPSLSSKKDYLVFVEWRDLDELDRITHAWIGFNDSLT